MVTGCASAIRDPRTSDRSAYKSSDQSLSGWALQKRWWNWAAGSSEAENPVADDTGRYCSPRQPDDVWFLADTFGEKLHRKCTVPAGRRLAGPALSIIEASSQECANSFRGAEGEAILDGVATPLDRIDPVYFSFDAAPDNAFFTESGPLSAYGCGLWLQLEPLKPGRHTLVIRGSNADFSSEVTYELTVPAPVPSPTPKPT